MLIIICEEIPIANVMPPAVAEAYAVITIMFGDIN